MLCAKLPGMWCAHAAFPPDSGYGALMLCSHQAMGVACSRCVPISSSVYLFDQMPHYLLPLVFAEENRILNTQTLRTQVKGFRFSRHAVHATGLTVLKFLLPSPHQRQCKRMEKGLMGTTSLWGLHVACLPST